MSVFLPHSTLPWRVSRSLNFASASSERITRTFAAGNRRTWTVALWLKRATTGARMQIFAQRAADTPGFDFEFQADNTIGIFSSGDAGALAKITSATFTGTGWEHWMVAVDTTQATAANRFRLYQNGIEITSWGTNTIPAQNYDTGVNRAFDHAFGYRPTTDFFNGNMADVYFVDGLQLTPDTFVSGSGSEIRPIRARGLTFGTNGFWLTFFDPTSDTTLGRDDGNGAPGSAEGSNDWTLTNTPTTSTDVPQ